MTPPPSGPTTHPTLGSSDGRRAEGGLKTFPHRLDLDAEHAQRANWINMWPERRPHTLQIGACGDQVEALGAEEVSRRAGAVAKQPEQHMLIRKARVSQRSGLDEGEPDHLPALWGQPIP